MSRGEVQSINSPQLYGSRKHHLTREALITTRLVYDMARLERRYMVSMFNDLKGCYDRVRPSLNIVTQGVWDAQKKLLFVMHKQ